MEDDQHLVQDYMRDFVLNQFKEITVKREHQQTSDTNNMQEELETFGSFSLPSSPPETLHSHHAVHINMPESPPIEQFESCGDTIFMEDWMWTMADPQPLDLRPIHSYETDWYRRNNFPLSMENNNSNILPQRSQSVFSATSEISPSTGESIHSDTCAEKFGLDETTLSNLTIKNLNKKLHGVPRDEIKNLKKIRRTIKNRGYAKACREKRVAYLDLLKKENEELQAKIHEMKSELYRVKQERDFLKQRQAMYTSQMTGITQGSVVRQRENYG